MYKAQKIVSIQSFLLTYRHRVEPVFESAVTKSGLLMKKGSRSANYSKRCIVLLSDRLVVYDKVGDSMPIVYSFLPDDSRRVLI